MPFDEDRNWLFMVSIQKGEEIFIASMKKQKKSHAASIRKKDS